LAVLSVLISGIIIIRWVPLDQLEFEMNEHPEAFTFWFRLLMMQPEMQSITQRLLEDKDGRKL